MNSFKIGTRLTLGFVFLLVLIAGLAGAGFWHLNAVSQGDISDSLRTQNEMAQWLLIALSAAALLIGIGLSVGIRRAIVQPLHNAMQLAQIAAARDLTTQVDTPGNDDASTLQRAIQKMTDDTRSMVSGVRHSAHEISAASSLILSGNDDLSARTDAQANSLTQTAAAMEQLTATVRQNADNAQQANTLALTAADVATRGGDIVSEVVTTMDSINDASKKVEDIIAVIDGIAFQTNILALNAAVESARAGEAGRGFAVVAGEVRSLAQRSAQAAQEIKELITASVTAAATGNRLVGDTGATMTEIVDAIQRVTDIMGEITAASLEQTSGIEQVNDTVLQMEQATRQNAELVENAAAAAGSLQEQGRHLEKLVSTYTIPDSALRSRKTRQTPAKSQASDNTTQRAQLTHHTDNGDTPTAPAVSKSRPGLPAPKSAARPASAPSTASAIQVGAFQTSAGRVEEWEEF